MSYKWFIQSHKTLSCLFFKAMTPLFKKLNFKDQQHIVVLNAPESFGTEMAEMANIARLSTRADLPDQNVPFTIIFAITASEVTAGAHFFATHTEGDAICWLAYPKGTSKKYKCEFNRDNGFDVLGEIGFEPVRMVAIDANWSALRFRRVEYIKTMTRSFAMTEQGKGKAQKSKA
jgi:hypothetical protein